jgi:hypothetical protein
MGLSTGPPLERFSAQIRIGSLIKDRRLSMLKKLLVTLIASAFAFTAFAQAPKSDTAPKAPAGAEAKKDTAPAKGEKKAKAKGEKKAKAKAKAKSDETKTKTETKK